MAEIEQNDNMDTEDVGGEKSFAELFNESGAIQGRFAPGERVDAVVVKITPEWVFIDIGGKNEGYLDIKEFLDADGNVAIKEGATVRAYFLYSKNNEKLFSTKIGKGDAGRAFLEDAAQSGMPVEGLVEKEVKGGFDVRIAGDVRAFCPFSQTGLFRVDTPADLVGQRLSFRIIEYAENGRNIIVSRRALLEEERAKNKDLLKESLREGALVNGTVVSLQKYGAFVDIGGVQALLPISEIAWGHVDDIAEKLVVGQQIEASVLKMDWENDRISLSLKSILPDPWEQAERDFPIGMTTTGTVARLTKFGAFVTLSPGVDGLVHISRIGRGKRISHPSEVLKEGQALEVRVEKIDREAKRISLVPADEVAESAGDYKKEEPDDFRKYLVKDSGALGSLGDLLQKKLGAKKGA
ncbi:MAG: 30S ribosomal protein S1 [Syntrophobacterales bacterium]|nr:30S ribosomal protein S1 [Syntrophobacterales bacterium]